MTPQGTFAEKYFDDDESIHTSYSFQKPTTQKYEKRIFDTESFSQIDDSDTSPRTYTEEIISEINGVILSFEDDMVKVKLSSNVYANFPKILFSNPQCIKIGQHVHYYIKRNREGFRYQELTPNDNIPQNPKKHELYELLNEIKISDD